MDTSRSRCDRSSLSGTVGCLCGGEGGGSRGRSSRVTLGIQKNSVDQVDYTVRSEDVGLNDPGCRVTRGDEDASVLEGDAEYKPLAFRKMKVRTLLVNDNCSPPAEVVV